MRRVFLGPLVLIGLATTPPARAADITDLASAFDEDNPFDFRLRVRYDHVWKTSQIKRELEGINPSALMPQDRILTVKDLFYRQESDILTLRAEAGLFQDLQLNVELPVILNQTSSISFDQEAGDGCRFGNDANPNCVNAMNSTTIRDGILPAGGFDAQRSGATLGGNRVFNSPVRGANGGGSAGDSFDVFIVGLSWAPVNQRRDDTKPTWTLSIEGAFSIGNIMKFDRARPGDNHAVSEGVHRIFARTAISKRYRYFDPYIGFWYMYPIARDDSLFKDYGPAQKTKNPQQMGGTVFGVEMIPYEKPSDAYKFAIDLTGRIWAHFNGKGYSEMWEVFASSPALACDPNFNLGCSPSAPKNAYMGAPFTGITAIENYASLAAEISLVGQIGRHAHFRAGFNYAHDGSHVITDDDIGTPLNGASRVSRPAEFNPAYRAVVDQTGRRYRVDNVNYYNVFVWGQLMF
jgi:hypothetical protein